MSYLMAIIFGAIGAIIALVILSAILRWLWNTTIPELFGLKELTFWQALKLLLITTILFGGPTSAAHVNLEDEPDAVDQGGETQ